MPDLFTLVRKWWKHILAATLLTVLVTALVILIRPGEYLGETTALPAPTYASDKAGVFNEHIQILYPALGAADDLDKILGTAKLDTVYAAVTDELNLVDYYREDLQSGEARQRAFTRLKKHCKVSRSDYGELKVRVWDPDRNQAAAMANAVMEQLRRIHRDIHNLNNESFLRSVQQENARAHSEYLALGDSIRKTTEQGPAYQLMLARLDVMAAQIKQYEKLQGEYELMVHTRPEVLVVVEKAVPPVWKDQLHPALVLGGAAVLGFLFGIFLSLILERRKTALS